jgi:hypothetical protein
MTEHIKEAMERAAYSRFVRLESKHGLRLIEVGRTAKPRIEVYRGQLASLTGEYGQCWMRYRRRALP